MTTSPMAATSPASSALSLRDLRSEPVGSCRISVLADFEAPDDTLRLGLLMKSAAEALSMEKS